MRHLAHLTQSLRSLLEGRVPQEAKLRRAAPNDTVKAMTYLRLLQREGRIKELIDFVRANPLVQPVFDDLTRSNLSFADSIPLPALEMDEQIRNYLRARPGGENVLPVLRKAKASALAREATKDITTDVYKPIIYLQDYLSWKIVDAFLRNNAAGVEKEYGKSPFKFSNISALSAESAAKRLLKKTTGGKLERARAKSNT